jgi:hypothetical protein
VLASDSEGLTLELVTGQVDVTPVTVNGERFERLRVAEYVHGYTAEPGLPQLPLKGVLIDLPEGKQARLEVLATESRVLSGYRVYPVPSYERAGDRLKEVFQWDRAGYSSSGYYPAPAAELSTEYLVRGQRKQRLVFYPLRFKAETGELLHCTRILVRVEFLGYAADVSANASAMAEAASEINRASGADTWGIPSGAAFKISTAGEGIYRVTRDWLTAQGIGDADIDAINLSQVQLFNLGNEQAIHIYDANGNQRLDAADHISFYAAAVPAAYAKFAKHNVYWLIDAGAASPRRMGTIDGTPAAGPLAASHIATAHHELDQLYLQSARGSDGLDRWIFSTVAMGSGFAGGGVAKDFTLQLPGGHVCGGFDDPDVQPVCHGAHNCGFPERGSHRQCRLERDRLDGGRVLGSIASGGGEHGLAFMRRGAGQDRGGLVCGGLRAGLRSELRQPEVRTPLGLPLPDRGLQQQ